MKIKFKDMGSPTKRAVTLRIPAKTINQIIELKEYSGMKSQARLIEELVNQAHEQLIKK